MAEFTARYLADYQPSLFTISTIDLTFDLSDTKTIVTSVMSVSRAGDDSGPLILDGEQLNLLSVHLNNSQLNSSEIGSDELSSDHYIVTENQLEIVTKEQEFTLTIVTEINPLENTSLEGLFKSGDAFCTQCEAEGFRRITYYLDRPDVMAIFTTKVIADNKLYPYLLSNGNKIDQGKLENGKHFTTWHDPFPKPCYLFALVAGDFDLLQDNYITTSGRNVALEIFVDKGNRSKAQHAMNALKNSMAWDEDTFDLEYDLDIYMIVAVDFFNMGAMENKGLNVFNSKYVLADSNTATDTDYFNVEAVIAHEYFHNWTGNRVTCRDWFQLSLKEGLTVFRDQQFSADMHSAAVTRIKNVRVLRSLQFAEDAGPMAHPIRPEKVMEMNNFYTLTVYEKGAEVIRMLHTLLGQEKFKKGLDLYFKRFDGMAVTCDDFVNAMADASNENLEQFKLWYSKAGTPTLIVKESFDESTGKFNLSINQDIPEAANTEKAENSATDYLHIPVKVELIDQKNNRCTSHLLQLTKREQTWCFERYEEKPIVAFLGGFSAPVKVDFIQTDNELESIMVLAEDEFCRWDAGQKLFITYLKKLVMNKQEQLPECLISSFANILTSSTDPVLTAEQLTLPNFDEVADLIDGVDPFALSDAITTLKLFLAEGLSDILLETYQKCQKTIYAVINSSDESKAALLAQRALKNVCLSYLATLPESQLLVHQQYLDSDNMTDTLSALDCSAKNNLPQFDEQMKSFEKRWSDTPLVMDKWFMVNGVLNSENIIQRLGELVKHPLFSLKNPNRARSLIASFAFNNPKHFHNITGEGYKFLASQIVLLNDINPQVASRLITPLIQFKGFDKVRQKLMRKELELLSLLPSLSKDLKEKLDAALS
ncbi:MAG: aminopeptidase N [Alteromonadaceae bacterium]|nr:aminopeptidase N [Alteromonadaceae bacterium]